MIVRRMTKKDIEDVVEIAALSFHGMRDREKGRKWIECNFNCYPRMQYFIAEEDGRVVGYILWVEKGGFREEAVLELEQIAVRPECRGRGIGTALIKESLEEMKRCLKERGSKLKLVLVTTGVENRAQRLYKKTLNAEMECVIKDMFRGDEAILVARFK